VPRSLEYYLGVAFDDPMIDFENMDSDDDSDGDDDDEEKSKSKSKSKSKGKPKGKNRKESTDSVPGEGQKPECKQQ
jgi:hypothetical protein